MKKAIFAAIWCLLLSTSLAAAGNVEVDGSLNISGTPTVDGIVFPDTSKQTTAVDGSQYQKRVTNTCTAGQAISVIDVNGGETCVPVGTGTVTSITAGSGLASTGGVPVTTSGTIGIANGGVTNAMLANPSITINTTNGVSGGANVSLGGTVNLSVSSINLSSQVSGTLAVANGGTGTTTIAGVRAAICPGYTAPAKAPVIATGQKITYLAGDDGNWQTGTATAPRFADNGNGTVTDNLTGLIWLKNAGCWTQNWSSALSMAASLASGTCGLTDSSVAGDWRMPNRNELESLLDRSAAASPALPANHPFNGVSVQYWTSTTSAAGSSSAWLQGMSGSTYIVLKSINYPLWPVRGNSAGKGRLPRTGETSTLNGTGSDGSVHKGVVWPNPRFTDNGDGTVTDNLTGLIWLKNANCTDTVGGISKSSGFLPWANAVTWSGNLANGNCSISDGSVAGDWRLPNVNEFESLLDASTSSPALPSGNTFLNVQSTGDYWTSTTYAPSTSSAWLVFMTGGVVDTSSKSNSSYVWPVRGGQ